MGNQLATSSPESSEFQHRKFVANEVAIKAEVQAKALTAKMQIEADRAKTEAEKAKAAKAMVILASVTGALLGLDLLLRNNDRFLKFWIKRTIKANGHTQFVKSSVLPKFRELEARPFATNPFKDPILLMGPSGCGKTHFLKTITAECGKIGRPTIYISIRGQESISTPYKQDDRDVSFNKNTCLSLQKSIGYSRPILFNFFRKLSYFPPIHETKIDRDSLIIKDVVRDTRHAINLLFSAVVEMTSQKDQKALIIFDDIIDLVIRNDLLRNIGDVNLLNTIIGQIVQHCVNENQCHVILAASSYFLVTELRKTILHEWRSVMELKDIEDKVVEDSLVNCLHWDRAIASKYIKLCGTRIRYIINKFNSNDPKMIEELSEHLLQEAKVDIAFLQTLEHWHELEKLLNDLYEGKTRTWNSVSDVCKPEVMEHIFYVNGASQVTFGSVVMKTAWGRLKAEKQLQDARDHILALQKLEQWDELEKLLNDLYEGKTRTSDSVVCKLDVMGQVFYLNDASEFHFKSAVMKAAWGLLMNETHPIFEW